MYPTKNINFSVEFNKYKFTISLKLRYKIKFSEVSNMDVLVLNKITGHENEINEIKNALMA